MKELHPIGVTEYAVANKILEKSAFYWWDKIYFKRRNFIINVVKSRYCSRTHKFGP